LSKERVKCRLCRREADKLFLKGDRCFSDRCSIERRAYAPGQHGQKRGRKASNYGIHLREKQKAKRIYGMDEKQFKLFFHRANKVKGKTGENLLTMLERRLDNVVYRLGCTLTRAEARQLVRHGHFWVNGRKADIPSMLVNVGDKIEVRDKSKKIERMLLALKSARRRGVPEWLELHEESMSGVVKNMPEREHISAQIDETLIVEHYSK
jgi:small subunit ribosomal protein S4